MRNEAETTLRAAEKYWQFADRQEIVARAFNHGLVAGWNARNNNRADLFEGMREHMRQEMTSPNKSSNA